MFCLSKPVHFLPVASYDTISEWFQKDFRKLNQTFEGDMHLCFEKL